MQIIILESRPLKGGKTKITAANGAVYYTEAGLEIPSEKNVDITVESVEKDGKTFQVVKAIKAVEQIIVPKSANIDTTKLADIPGTVQVVPSLPVTSLPETKAPGGSAPIKKAGAVKVSGDPDKMSRQDWADKERRIELVAVIKSTVESAAYQELIIGKNVEDALKTFDVLVDHYVAKLDELKSR